MMSLVGAEVIDLRLSRKSISAFSTINLFPKNPIYPALFSFSLNSEYFLILFLTSSLTRGLCFRFTNIWEIAQIFIADF